MNAQVVLLIVAVALLLVGGYLEPNKPQKLVAGGLAAFAAAFLAGGLL